MVKDIFTLAFEYQNKLQPLTKTAAKEKMNRGRMGKSLEKTKADYAKYKRDLDVLEADDAKLKEKLDTARGGAAAARQRMLKLHKAMQHMDLASANDAVFYADDEDVGYVINGKEYHLDVDDTGDVKLTPMNAHRKAKKGVKPDVGTAKDDEDDDKVTCNECDKDCPKDDCKKVKGKWVCEECLDDEGEEADKEDWDDPEGDGDDTNDHFAPGSKDVMHADTGDTEFDDLYASLVE
jgi:hypothetical protein